MKMDKSEMKKMGASGKKKIRERKRRGVLDGNEPGILADAPVRTASFHIPGIQIEKLLLSVPLFLLLAVGSVTTGMELTVTSVPVLATGTELTITTISVVVELAAGTELTLTTLPVVVVFTTGTELSTRLVVTTVSGVNTELSAVELSAVGLLNDLISLGLFELDEAVSLGASLGVLGEVGVGQLSVLAKELLGLFVGGAPSDVSDKQLLGGIAAGGEGVGQGEAGGREGDLGEGEESGHGAYKVVIRGGGERKESEKKKKEKRK